MAKSFKFCTDCQCTHAVGECGSEPTDRRQDRRRREKVREAEYSIQFQDPMTFDP